MKRVTFNNKHSAFAPALKQAINEYFEKKGIPQTGDARLYTKAVVWLSMYVACYFVLIMAPLPVWALSLVAGFYGFVHAAIGFNVMHDANHGSFSSNSKVNSVFAYTMNVLGSISFIWKQKHNLVHHTYTNVDGVDDDIEKVPLLRMCKSQPRKWYHRFQQVYVLPLYAVSTIFWLFFKDYVDYFSKHSYNIKVPEMTTADKVSFWISKILHTGVMVVLPLYLLGPIWLWYTLVMHIVMGTTVAIVFQLAHVVEPAEFEDGRSVDQMSIEEEWAIHQLKTTCDFAVNSKILTWLLGGLNFQVEHHLFPKMSHVHYPQIRKILMEQCEKFGVEYKYFPTMSEAVASHFRLMRDLGKHD